MAKRKETRKAMWTKEDEKPCSDWYQLKETLKDSIVPVDLVLQVMLETGCRVDEVVKLEADGVTEDSIHLKGSKKSNDRHRHITPNLSAKLKRLKLKSKQNMIVRSIWPGSTAKSIRLYIWRRMAKLTKKKYHPYSLRHTFVHLTYIASGKDLLTTSVVMGHKNPANTMMYLQDINNEHANDSIMKLVA